MAALEERWLERDHEIAELRSRISRFEAEVPQLHDAPWRFRFRLLCFFRMVFPRNRSLHQNFSPS
jgi:hypothetical protein